MPPVTRRHTQKENLKLFFILQTLPLTILASVLLIYFIHPNLQELQQGLEFFSFFLVTGIPISAILIHYHNIDATQN